MSFLLGVGVTIVAIVGVVLYCGYKSWSRT